MQRHTIQVGFFLLLFTAALVATFFIFRSFIWVIFLSAVLAVSFHPLYLFFIRKWGKEHSHISAFATIFVISVCIIVPLGLISIALVKDAASVYNSIAFGDGASQFISKANRIVTDVEKIFAVNLLELDIDIGTYARNLLLWFIDHFDNLFAIVINGILKFLLMLMALYYMLIHATSIKKILLLWSPLPNSYDKEIMAELKTSFDAVFKGRILVAVAQGAFMGIGFAIFGLSNSVLWGFVTAIAALIPIVGTAVVSIPAVAFLFLAGSLWKGVGLLLWSAVAVGMVDNILSFYFFRGKISVHPLIILFSVLGGVELFGAIGYLVGPVIISSLVALSRIYPFIMDQKTEV